MITPQKKILNKTVKLLKVDMKTKCRLNRVINLLLIVYYLCYG